MSGCHPTHAMRTKCACGAIVILRGAYGKNLVRCACGRGHKKESAPGGSFAKADRVGKGGHLSTGKRIGGRAGCPGIDFIEPKGSIDSGGVKK